MRKALVVCYGYLGDHLFASSIAKKLLEEKQFDMVDYVVGFPQVIPLLKLNAFIHEVFYEGIPTPSPRVLFNNGYDKIIQLGPLSFVEPPCVEFQKLAGIRNPTPDFQVYTDSTVDEMVKDHFKTITDVPIVAVMSNWEPKTFRFTKEQYEAGIDVPNKGYGGSWRNIKYIVEQLEKRIQFKRAVKKAISLAYSEGQVEGIKVQVSGRLNGAEIARTEWYLQGQLPLHTLRADIDYGFTEAHTTYGVIGIKCWVYKGEILPGGQRRGLRNDPEPRRAPRQPGFLLRSNVTPGGGQFDHL